MGHEVVILVPMLGRPHRVAPLLASITAATPEPHRVLWLVTSDDTEVGDAVETVGGEPLMVPWQGGGDYARKINAGYRHTSEPLVFCAACDLEFHVGWLAAAMARLDGTVGVVGTNDLGNRRVMAGEHATHSLVTRAYADTYGTIDEPGKILHEGYRHEYVDDELVGTAKARGAWAFAADSVVEHLHPHWGKAPSDTLYEAQAGRMSASRHLYLRRRRLWMSP